MARGLKRKARSRLEKKSRRGFRGYPVATIAYYSPSDEQATEVAVGIVPAENAEAEAGQRWFSEVIH